MVNHDRKKTKAALISEAKNIADAIFNRLSVDAVQDEEIYGDIEGTDGGVFGPFQEMWGWAVSVSLESPVDAEVKAQDWLDLVRRHHERNDTSKTEALRFFRKSFHG